MKYACVFDLKKSVETPYEKKIKLSKTKKDFEPIKLFFKGENFVVSTQFRAYVMK